MRYYYPPFKSSDAVERKTWDYYATKGYVHFLCPANPCLKPLMTPEELGAQLAKDGLPDAKINIRLLCCFGAGRHELNPNYANWKEGAGLEGTIAERLAIALQGAAPQVVVAGYLGPTQTGHGPTRVRVFGDSSTESNLVLYNTARPNLSHFAVYDDPRRVLDAHQSSRQTEAVAPKLFIAWYDTQGKPSRKWVDRPADDKSTQRPQINADKPLEHLKDGDLLLIHAHGVPTGWILRSPGISSEEMHPVTDVNVSDRQAQQPSKPLWEKPPNKWGAHGMPQRSSNATAEQFALSKNVAPKVR